jgi:hypothetical protein
MTMKFFSAGIVMAGLLALTACKSSSPGGAGGTGGTGGTGGAGGSGGTGGTAGGGGTGGTPSVDCTCACGAGTPAALVCNDPAHPSFCAGTAPVAGGQCETALAACGFTAADIAALGCN